MIQNRAMLTKRIIRNNVTPANPPIAMIKVGGLDVGVEVGVVDPFIEDVNDVLVVVAINIALLAADIIKPNQMLKNNLFFRLTCGMRWFH